MRTRASEKLDCGVSKEKRMAEESQSDETFASLPIH